MSNDVVQTSWEDSADEENVSLPKEEPAPTGTGQAGLAPAPADAKPEVTLMTTEPPPSSTVVVVPATEPQPHTEEKPKEEPKEEPKEAVGETAEPKDDSSPPKPLETEAAPKNSAEEEEEVGVVASIGKEETVPEVMSTAPIEDADPRDHLSVVFIGHVDAGKSTIAGNVLYLTGQVDQRTIEKYQQEAKEKAGSSWYLAFIMDINEDERAKGKTVEVGRAHFETEKRRYTVLDAPGHKNYVPNMIGGASQADVGILVISARRGEFETGFDRGGQTREHAMLAKTLGVGRLIVAVNKMDDKTVEWDVERYNEIVKKLGQFLKSSGFKPREISYLPISGINGLNLKDPMPEGICPWYSGPPLLQALDELPLPKRDAKAPLRIPILDRLKDSGKLIIQGKVESGVVTLGQKLVIMPGKKVGKVIFLGTDLKEIRRAGPGENVRVVLSGITEDHVRTGFVLCAEEQPILAVPQFEAQVFILELLPHKPIFSPGYSAVFHCHTIVEECNIKMLVNEVDRKTGKPGKKKPKFVKKGGMVIARIEVSQPVCIETYKTFPQLGRFTLRDEGKTIAIGTVTRLPGARPTESS